MAKAVYLYRGLAPTTAHLGHGRFHHMMKRRASGSPNHSWKGGQRIHPGEVYRVTTAVLLLVQRVSVQSLSS